MSKKLLLFLCLCILSAILAMHLFKPVAKLSVPLTDASTDLPTNSVTVVVPAQAQQDSNSVDAIQPAVTNDPADIPDETAQNEQNEQLWREWAVKDPKGALAAAMQLPEGDERNQTLTAVCYGIGQTDPANALSIAQKLNLDKQPGAIMENLLQQWADADLQSALDWVTNQPASDRRNDYAARLAFVLSQTQPVDAATLVLNQIPPGAAQDQAILTVLDLWANQDIPGAITWANEFPDGPLRKSALNSLEHRRLVAQ